MWARIRAAINADPTLAEQVELWTFRYPTYDGIRENATALAAAIRTQLAGRIPIVVAHSMGGLVATQAMYQDQQLIRQLISLGTPYFGSPLAEASVLSGRNPNSIKLECSGLPYEWLGPRDTWMGLLLDKSGPGLRDLRPTGAIAQENRMLLSQLGSRIVALGGTNPGLLFGGFRLVDLSCLLAGQSDGVVELASAYGGLSVRASFPASHFDIYDSPSAVSRVVAELRASVVPTAQATRLAFTVLPTSGRAGDILVPAIEVEAQDATLRRVASATGSVTLALSPPTNGAQLSGQLTRPLVGGRAIFTDIRIDRGGTYSLTASLSGLTTALSGAVVITAQPPAITALTVSPATLSVAVGATAMANASVQQPAGAPAATVTYATYATSNPAIATVTGSGPTATIRGVAAGTATITVTAQASGTATFAPATVSRQIAVTVTGGGGGGPGGTGLGRGFGAEQFALISTNSFPMGSTNGSTNERPVRTVTISSFRMQRTEVTQAQWRQVMQGTGRENPSRFSTCGDTCPVESVSWNDIQTFLTRLNQQDQGKNYRLPTEAEWEFAARAGTTGDYGGNGVLNDMGWWCGNSNNRTHPAAQKRANDWGLFDMHGNAWEWVNDWYSASYYSTGPNVDPLGPPSGSARVLRGGSWSCVFNTADARSAHRTFGTPDTQNSDYGLGFRLARTTVQPQVPAISGLTVSPATVSVATNGSTVLSALVTQPSGAPAATLTFTTSNRVLKKR